MGVAESPLKDRVIFVQGAPRSGTTWLVMLLATHPQIAGVEAESHLFEFGVDRLFDNFEGRNEHLHGLQSYMEREELIDLVRDLCDGVLSAMRSHVGGGSEPEFVVEKTPTSANHASLDLSRKRECFPDGWYLHIVRDGDAVTRSLMKAPWVSDRSEAYCRKLWSDSVSYTRECLADLPRYREVDFGRLVENPSRTAAEVFEWLGADAGPGVLETASSLLRERFSELGALPPVDDSGHSIGRRARRAASFARVAVGRGLEALVPKSEAADAGSTLTFGFARALRERDVTALSALTSDSVALAVRSPDGDLRLSGDEARTALLEMAAQIFAKRHVSERWASTTGVTEWWNRGPGHEFSTIFFTGLLGDADRVDVAFALSPTGGRISEIVAITAGPLSGRQQLVFVDAGADGLPFST